MEFITTDEYFIFQNVQKGENNLWCHRRTGKFEVRPSWDLAAQDNPECHGLVYALLGKLKIHPELCERLVVVKQCERIGELPGRGFQQHPVYKVQSVVHVPIYEGPLGQLNLKSCPKHHGVGIPVEPTVSTDVQNGQSKLPFGKIGGSLKSLATDTIKTTAGTASAIANQVKAPWKANAPITTGPPAASKQLERFERRILEEFGKMFNQSDSFYFSFTGDLTNALQRQVDPNLATRNEDLPVWRRANDRFFFNKSMIQDLIDLNDSRADPWIVPFIQGYIEMQQCPLDLSDSDDFYSSFQNQADASRTTKLPTFYTIAVVSRRSRHRAGTRYKRRGVDTEGHVANYVETEQVLLYHHYALSFVQVRGSIPVYWSQPGVKYRPPPKLDRTPEEDQEAFIKHFCTEFETYGAPINIVNLAEKNGREKVVFDAYFERALEYNDDRLSFVSFDFHEYCRGMRFENVAILITAIEYMIRANRYCWMDSHGVVCTQQGVFRVNCIDCLDRTNVVQTAIAKAVLEIQLTKLGVVPPDQDLPESTRMLFQSLWANNGDVLSRQYAGTNALKGDFTRTGERNLSGMMKDGMNSASRYYLNQFRDAYRQATIEVVTGQPVSEELVVSEIPADEEEEKEEDTAEHVKLLIEDCKRMLITDLDQVIGSWGLINNDPVTGDPRQMDMDTILILTRDSYFVAHYDDDIDKVTEFQRVLLPDVDKIEFGIIESAFAFRTSKEHNMRIHYRVEGEPGYFHVFRSTNLRFFNNMAVVVNTEEERIESLKSIADTVAVAVEMTGNMPDVWFGKLEKKKSRVIETDERPTSSFRAVSSKFAFTNVTSQISKLNPIAKLKLTTRRSATGTDENKPAEPSSNGLLPTSRSFDDALNDAALGFQLTLERTAPVIEITGEVIEGTASAFSNILSPLGSRVRKLSKSTEDVEAVEHPTLRETLSQKSLTTNLSNLSINALEDSASAVLSPLAKLTKGIQSFGASLGPKSSKETSKESSEMKLEDAGLTSPQVDLMYNRVADSETKTKFVLL